MVEDPDIPRNVTRIFAGGNTSMCCDRKGNWYMWGLDLLRQSKSIQQKPSVSFMNVRSVIPYPQLVNLFSFEVKDLAIGEQHILALDTDGNVYAAGSNLKGQCAATGEFIPQFTKVNVPAGMQGVFAIGYVSGCYGPEGLYMWGDCESLIMSIFTDKTEGAKPRAVPNLKNVEMVKASGTHILVQCAVEQSRKRETEGEEESEAKKAKVDA